MSTNSAKKPKEKLTSPKKVFANLLVRENNKEISSLILSSKIQSIHRGRMNNKSNDFNQSNGFFKKDEYSLKETIKQHQKEFFMSNKWIKQSKESLLDLLTPNILKNKSIDNLKSKSNISIRQDISHLLDSTPRLNHPNIYQKERILSNPNLLYYDEDLAKKTNPTEFDDSNSISKRSVITPPSHGFDTVLFTSLKKELSSFQTSNPPNRVEALILKDWMENNIENIKKKKFGKKIKLRKIWEVLSLSFAELTRQNYFECNERGILLQNVFKYLEDFKKEEEQQIKEEKKKIKIEGIEAYNRVHIMYRKEIEERKKEKDVEEGKKKDEEKKRIEVQKENGELERARQTMQKQITEMGNALELLKKKLRLVKRENEKLVLKCENHANKIVLHKESKQLPTPPTPPSITSSSSSIVDEKEETLNGESFNDLNQVIVTCIPDQMRNERLKDCETFIATDFFEMNFKSLEIQTDLSLMDTIFDQTMIKNNTVKEMAEDYFYKLEIEQEEIVQRLAREQEEAHKNKKEKAEIHRKLSEYKLKHKMKQDSPMSKFHNALDKLKLLNLFTIGEHNEKNDDDSENSQKGGGTPLVQNKLDDNQFETEEEESESEAQNDETRQENIIEELNHESFSSSSSREVKKNKKKEMNEKNTHQLRKSEVNNNKIKPGTQKFGSVISIKNADLIHNQVKKKRNTEVRPVEKRFEITEIQNNSIPFVGSNKNFEIRNDDKPIIEKIEKEDAKDIVKKEDNNISKKDIMNLSKKDNISKDNLKKEEDINLMKKETKKNIFTSKDSLKKEDDINIKKNSFENLRKRNSLSNIFEATNINVQRGDLNEKMNGTTSEKKIEKNYSKRNSVRIGDSSNFQCKLPKDSKANALKKGSSFSNELVLNNKIIPKLREIENKNLQIEKDNNDLKVETLMENDNHDLKVEKLIISEFKTEEGNSTKFQSGETLDKIIIIKNNETNENKKKDESFSDSESSEKSSQARKKSRTLEALQNRLNNAYGTISNRRQTSALRLKLNSISLKKPINEEESSSAKKRSNFSKAKLLKEIETELCKGIESLPEDVKRYDLLTKYKQSDEQQQVKKEEFLRLLILYKTENRKAKDLNEKFKRTNDILEIETLTRSKLEDKQNEILKTFALLQKELENSKNKNNNLEHKLMECQKKLEEKTEISPTSQLKHSSSIQLKEIKLTRGSSFIKKKTKAIKSLEGPTPASHFNKLKTIKPLEMNKNSGFQLLEKIKSKSLKKFDNFMHVKLILKQINLIYAERINATKENESMKQQFFSNEIYNYYLGLFGLKKIADKRFIIFVLSLKKYISYFRINMFAKLFGLFTESKLNYSIEELNKYIEALDFCLNLSTMGVNIINLDSEAKFYIPFIRALQYTGLFADTRMSMEENQELKKDIENLKEPDSRGINKAGIIDFDLFMERVLTKYRFLVNRAKTYVINAFAASDLDGNGMCNLDEFLLLNRHIEKDRYEKTLLEKIFFDYADLDNDGEKNLSFDKFSVVCVDHNLFSDEAQDIYLHIQNNKELDSKMDEVRTVWFKKKLEILDVLDSSKIIQESDKQNWFKIMSVLEDRILGSTQVLKPTLIAYNMLIEEMESLKKAQEENEKKEKEEQNQRMTEENEGMPDSQLILQQNTSSGLIATDRDGYQPQIEEEEEEEEVEEENEIEGEENEEDDAFIE